MSDLLPVQNPMYKCAIYENRPQICKNFPLELSGIIEHKSCSYKFDKRVRSGICNQCGECCFLHKDIFGLGRKFNGDPCPYLEKI